MPKRFFENHFNDYQNEPLVDSVGQLENQLFIKINRWIEEKLLHLESNLHRIDRNDCSIYTGIPGLALLYLRLASHFADRKEIYLTKANDLIGLGLKRLDERVCTFLCGAAGPLAIAAVIHHRNGDSKKKTQCIEQILSMKNIALSRSTPDEYLYGRSGYLFTLMFLRREFGDEIIPTSLVTEIFEKIIQSGENYARQIDSPSKLMFQWYRTEYLGAAHGVSGIVFLLLKTLTDDPSLIHLRPYITSHLMPTIVYLETRRLPSGNYMSSNNDSSDQLVQWCHGAPGFVYAFAQAYQISADPSFLERAIAAGEIIWKNGLLTKGFGLCHGAAGNAYSLLKLYQITRDMKWLHRAIQFAHFCVETNERNLIRSPDCPFSLFEGLAGTIYFLIDLVHPDKARFPGFDLN